MILEICIDSIESALAAKAGGADRLEVCSSLVAGGTTPSIGLVKRCVAETGLPVMMMIRPHDGPFVYSPDDLQVMKDNIIAGIAANAFGFVFGCLDEGGAIHREQNAELLKVVGDCESTFHRAFDVTNARLSPMSMLDQLIELGFDRLLTSGKCDSAYEGCELIKQLVDHSASRIKILAGAGVNAENAVAIVGKTSVAELHGSASVACLDRTTLGSTQRVTSVEKVQAIRAAIGNK